MYRRKLHSSSEMRYSVNRTAIHVLSQNHRIRDKMLHACTSRGATCTVKQGRIVQTQNFIFGRFFFFFYYPNGTWTHPPTSKLFLDFWNFFNFAKPLSVQPSYILHISQQVGRHGIRTKKTVVFAIHFYEHNHDIDYKVK